MPRNILLAAFVFGGVLVLFGSPLANQTPTNRSQADHSTNAGATAPSQTPPDKPQAVLPAGVISDNEDSVQILDVSPAPGSYLRRGEPRLFKMKVAYNLKSADVAILSMSVAQIRESQAGCAGSGHLPDAMTVKIKRGRHLVDIALRWSGDSGKASKGIVDMKGYLRFVPMFWQSRAGGRGDRIRLFEGYEKVCMRFGP